MRRYDKAKANLQARLQSTMQSAVECVLEDYAGLFTATDSTAAVEGSASPAGVTFGAAVEGAGLLTRHKNGKVILSHLELLLKLNEAYGMGDEKDDEDYKKRLILKARNSLQGEEEA